MNKIRTDRPALRLATTGKLLFESIIHLIILLFVYTAVSKIIEHDKFIFQMRLAPLPLMRHSAPALSWLVPAVELLIVAMLVMERWRLKGLYASFLLLLSFQIYIIYMLLSGSKLPCTCGGIVSKMSWTQHLWFNFIFMVLAAAAIIIRLNPHFFTFLNISRVRKRV